MSTRISSAALLVALAGCGNRQPEAVAPDARSAQVECAIGDGEPFKRECTLKRTGDVLTVSTSNGSFRRLLLKNGQIEAADGAERASVTATQTAIEVQVGQDVFRLPAELR